MERRGRGVVVGVDIDIDLAETLNQAGHAGAGRGTEGAEITSALSPDQFNTTGEGIGPAGIGLWLLLVNYLALRSKALPRGLTWIGLIAGVGWLLSGVGALIGGSQILPFSIGPLGIFLVSPIWAIWLGRRLLAQPDSVPQMARSG